MDKKIRNINLTDIENFDIEGVERIVRLDSIYISSRPISFHFAGFLKEHGITRVLDIKVDGQECMDEKEMFSAHGIKYYHLPVSDILDIDLNYLEKFHDFLNEANDNVLVYCVSANRVGALMCLYLSNCLGHAKELAFDTGKKVGLTKDTMCESIARKLSLSVKGNVA